MRLLERELADVAVHDPHVQTPTQSFDQAVLDADAVVIAEALSWLVSPANSHMAGQVIYVDGGAEATLRGPRVF